MVKKAIYVIGAMALATTIWAFTGYKNLCGHPSPEEIVERVSQHLGLDETQQTQLSILVEELAQKAQALHDDRELIFNTLLDQVRQEQVDRQAVDLMIGEKRRQVDEMIDLAVSGLIDFHAMLTPEQRQLLAEEMEQHHCRNQRFHRW